ncbi:hypothetical protein Hanom_Chr00s077670g01791951 [Helianthus anomalus]
MRTTCLDYNSGHRRTSPNHVEQALTAISKSVTLFSFYVVLIIFHHTCRFFFVNDVFGFVLGAYWLSKSSKNYFCETVSFVDERR